MKNWFMAVRHADFDEIAKKHNISPFLARIIRNRDIIGDDAIDMYLNGTVKDMHDPHKLKDVDKAASLLFEAVTSGEKIFIVGDYDADGVCSSYILLKGLSYLGGNARVRLPNRVTDGYGINTVMIDEAVEWGAGIILTCDNGIAAFDETEYAKEKGLKVIITDHHEVPYEESKDEKKYIIPEADAVVDPKREDCDYPFSEICGCMVAYKLLQCIFETAGKGEELLPELLMFTGFATVEDVMGLRDENRIAVRNAIELMKTTENPGMKSLIDVTGIDRSKLSPYHIGFILGPCINASGRLDSANRALLMFTSDTYEEALPIAMELKELNDSRKELTERYLDKAVEIIESDPELGSDRVLVIHIPDCHESLAGIIAGRIREKYYRPVFVLTGENENVKGSGRSIEAYNMHGEMSRCAEFFTKFGGHKMAAGLSMNEKDIEGFREKINEYCTLTDDEMTEKMLIDIPLPVEYATMDLAKELSKLEPYGNGNRRPLFARKDLIPYDIKVLGKNRNTVKLKLRSGDHATGSAEAICYGDGDEIAASMKEKGKIDIAYEISINTYMDRSSVQLVIKDFR